MCLACPAPDEEAERRNVCVLVVNLIVIDCLLLIIRYDCPPSAVVVSHSIDNRTAVFNPLVGLLFRYDCHRFAFRSWFPGKRGRGVRPRVPRLLGASLARRGPWFANHSLLGQLPMLSRHVSHGVAIR